MKVGFSRQDISPPIDTQFGCFVTERQIRVIGHHDPLWASATVISHGNDTVALVSCDLALMTSSVVHRARKIINGRTGIPESNVLISHTHVHSAPGGTGTEAATPGVDPDYFGEPAYTGLVMDRIAKAVEEAFASMEECELKVTSQPIEGIGTTRDRREPPYQPYAGLLEFVRPDGTVKAVIISYACHPSIVGFSNLLTSSDFVGVTCDAMSQALGGAGVMLLMAPAGDVSTRNTRKEQTYAEVDRLGKVLADQLLAIRPRLEAVKVDEVKAFSKPYEVPIGPLPSIEDLEKAVEKTRAALDKMIAERPDDGSENGTYNMPMGAVLEQYVYWSRARNQLEKVKSVKVSSAPSEVQVIKLGPVLFLGVECELHTPREAEIRSQVPYMPLFIVAPANGSLGNITGKSKNPGILAAPAGDALVSASVELLNEVLKG
ncbi:MAG TPA: hypothetical protein GXX23_10115 [Firmicutes bacterium]|nr:hypothetical protein [Candidatus Fermentithermobacillaceae bacterium]